MTEENGNKLYVGNVAYTATESDLAEFISGKGINPLSVAIIKDKYTERSKGFSFVTVENEEDVDKAIEALNGQDFQGRPLTVSKARPREKRSGDFRGGRGGGDRRPNGGQRRPY
jgi:RNA recognition motif-containing protein